MNYRKCCMSLISATEILDKCTYLISVLEETSRIGQISSLYQMVTLILELICVHP